MNIYKLIRLFVKIRSNRIRRMGVLAFHLMGRRYMGVFLDPVMACNLRCRMCYMSAPGHKPEKGTLSLDDYEHMARSMFHRILKLQIGCSAEPTLYAHLGELVATAKRYGVPYVAVTTNGNLLTKDRLEKLAQAGLNELTVSTHGLTAATYEHFMQRGKFNLFLQLLDNFREVKKNNPDIKLRINYTVNEENLEDLTRFSEVFHDTPVDILQVRPVQNLGESDYHNFSLEKIYQNYDRIFSPLEDYCRAHGITFLFPSKENLSALQGKDESAKGAESLQDMLYAYAYPEHIWHGDFDYHNETFEQYCQRKHIVRTMLRAILNGKNQQKESHRTKSLNYKVK